MGASLQWYHGPITLCICCSSLNYNLPKFKIGYSKSVPIPLGISSRFKGHENGASWDLLQEHKPMKPVPGRPHTQYAGQVWNPHSLKDIDQLEQVEKFASCMCAKQWDLGYAKLLNLFVSAQECRDTVLVA